MPDPKKRTALDVLSDLNTIRGGKMPDGSSVEERKKREAAKNPPPPPKPEEKSYFRRAVDYLTGDGK